MNNKRKICVVTGTRAEYGLLYWLMKEINNDERLELQIIATGMHLSPEFGLTFRVIEQEGFIINEKIEMLLSSDTPVGVAKSIGLATIGFADALMRLQPDILVLLGDRYEILAAAQVAMAARIPIAHIHGGEKTEGAIDEAIRHAVTKMSQIHFVAAEPYRQRVIQLGENPERVMNFGALGLEGIRKMKLLNRQEFEQTINFELGQINFLVTYHPVTLNKEGSAKAMNAIFEVLDQYPEARIIFTKPNSDSEGRLICQMIDEYVSKQPRRAFQCTSLGQLGYLSAIRHVDVVIGNSSSGIIEVPALGKPTVNIGDRQKGRLKSLTIIDCAETSEAILAAVQKSLSAEFQSLLTEAVSEYSQGNTSVQIKEYLKNVRLNELVNKQFYDLF